MKAVADVEKRIGHIKSYRCSLMGCAVNALGRVTAMLGNRLFGKRVLELGKGQPGGGLSPILGKGDLGRLRILLAKFGKFWDCVKGSYL